MWLTPTDPMIHAVWADAIELEPETLALLMASAYEVCSAYAPPVTGEIPASFKLAQVLQARQIWSDLAGGNAAQMGSEEYGISSFPLIIAARQLLRPKVSPLGMLR